MLRPGWKVYSSSHMCTWHEINRVIASCVYFGELLDPCNTLAISTSVIPHHEHVRTSTLLPHEVVMCAGVRVEVHPLSKELHPLSKVPDGDGIG